MSLRLVLIARLELIRRLVCRARRLSLLLKRDGNRTCVRSLLGLARFVGFLGNALLLMRRQAQDSEHDLALRVDLGWAFHIVFVIVGPSICFLILS